MKRSLVRQAVERMHAYAPGEQPREPGFIKLNTNENPYPPSAAIQEVLQRPFDRLRLYPDPLCMDLRVELARLHGRRPEQVFVGNGSDEVLALCVRAFVERTGSVGYFEPSYSLYPVLATAEELAVRPVPLNSDFSWAMPAEYAASLFFLTTPNAPTGVQYPRETVREFCAHFPGVVVLDEAYVDFAREHFMDLALEFDNVLVARSFSKSYSLAGLRVGYVVGAEPLIGALFKIKDSYNVDRLAQEIALAAVLDQKHMRRNVECIQMSREHTAATLRERGFDVGPSESNFLWVKPPRRPAAEWHAALREQRILVRHFPGKQIGAYLRITIGTESEMTALLDALNAGPI
ncbi:MAG: histidinol-phosphate transaminase [Verrucomicrobia bacterium]|nr:histidinol-phosphate transaminase [Verrucomicrobiota bacterium]